MSKCKILHPICTFERKSRDFTTSVATKKTLREARFFSWERTRNGWGCDSDRNHSGMNILHHKRAEQSVIDDLNFRGFSDAQFFLSFEGIQPALCRQSAVPIYGNFNRFALLYGSYIRAVNIKFFVPPIRKVCCNPYMIATLFSALASVSSCIVSVRNGKPQWIHFSALSDTGCPHSGQFIMAIFFSFS